MKNAIAIVVVLLVGVLSPAFGQRHGTTGNSALMATMMKGLTPQEKEVAHRHMAKMSPAEKAVMMKRCSTFYNSPHPGVDPARMTTNAWMKEMNSGLTKSEQKTMAKMMAKMTPQERAVGEKILTNCFQHGVSLRHGHRRRG